MCSNLKFTKEFCRNLDISRPELEELVNHNINTSSHIFEHGISYQGRHAMVYRSIYICSAAKLKRKADQHMLPRPFIGAFWFHVCPTRKRFFWSKGDLSYSQVKKISISSSLTATHGKYKPLAILKRHHQVPGPLSSLDGGCDQSNCHHSGNSS